MCRNVGKKKKKKAGYSNLREIRLKGAVERPGLNVFGDKSLFPEHV